MKNTAIPKRKSLLNKRSKERAKRRFEEKDEFFNENFFNNFKSRRRKNKEWDFHDQFNENIYGGDMSANMKGTDIKIELDLNFFEAVKGTTKGLIFNRLVTWDHWNGTRGEPGTKINVWYSCKGEGVKKDHLFGNYNKCNTWDGHGQVPTEYWKKWEGTGLIQQEVREKILIPAWTNDGDFIRIEKSGNKSPYTQDGKFWQVENNTDDGDLIVKIVVQNNGKQPIFFIVMYKSLNFQT